ncbi:MAG: hypothetical protein Fur0010_10320 [Bdellovibrio sp.]
MSLLKMLMATVCSVAFAYNTQYIDLNPLEGVVVDVAGTPGHVSLRLKLESGNALENPKAVVLTEYNGFECEIDRVLLLFSGYNQSLKKFNQEWEIRVNWFPGADLSGCEIEVTHSSLPWARAELYMKY